MLDAPLRPGSTASGYVPRTKPLPGGHALGQDLPAGGETTWEIRNIKEVVTFALFDPDAPGIGLPAGLSFIPAKRVPEAGEYLERHPEHGDWAFSVIEIARQEHFVIDGRAPQVPGHGAIGLWLAPVDASGLKDQIPAETFTALIGEAEGSVLLARRANIAYSPAEVRGL